jgi:hypothetical protein
MVAVEFVPRTPGDEFTGAKLLDGALDSFHARSMFFDVPPGARAKTRDVSRSDDGNAARTNFLLLILLELLLLILLERVPLESARARTVEDVRRPRAIFIIVCA